MVTKISPIFDSSHWKVRDKSWRDSRQKHWGKIEPMIKNIKPSKAMPCIKQYFMKGKEPDWGKFREWNNPERHLDIFLYLWLHPSRDIGVLRELRESYLKSNVIVYEDVFQGVGNFVRWGVLMACQDYSGADPGELKLALETGGENELIFDVLFGDLVVQRCDLKTLNIWGEIVSKSYTFPSARAGYLCNAAKWLSLSHMDTINSDMLLQYEKPFRWLAVAFEADKKIFSKAGKKIVKAIISRGFNDY